MELTLRQEVSRFMILLLFLRVKTLGPVNPLQFGRRSNHVVVRTTEAPNCIINLLSSDTLTSYENCWFVYLVDTASRSQHYARATLVSVSFHTIVCNLFSRAARGTSVSVWMDMKIYINRVMTRSNMFLKT